MKKLVALIAALSVTLAAAPATSVALDHDVHAAKAKKKKKKKKKKRRYRIAINYESKTTDVKDCKSTTEENLWRIKDTTTTTTKYSESGFYPGGSRRTGYRETTIKTESTDPYVPSSEATLPRQEIQEAYGRDQWDFQINAKRTKFSYDWESADGSIEDVVIRAPTKVGKSVTRNLNDTDRSDPTTDEDGRCTTWSERTVNEQVTITREQ